MLKKLFNIIILLVGAITAANAQELNCKVKVMHGKIQNTDASVFTTMERAISDFLNTRKWTSDEYNVSEKIDCNILINLTSKMGDDPDGYLATINIQASRPVYNTSYTSPTINYVDRDLQFHYSQFNPLQFDDNRVTGADPLASNLSAVLAYYAYLLIGLDYDSFSPQGGTAFLKKAQNIVNNAPESKSISGWKAVENNKNRYWLIDQMLSPRFEGMRSYWYTIHREGLDSMYTKPAAASQRILGGISKLSQVQKDNPSSILMQFFFNAKGDEIMKMVAQLPRDQRATYIALLAQLDVPNAAKYNALK